FAADPVTGIVSADHTVTVLGDLVGLEIFRLPDPAVFAIGGDVWPSVRAVFEYGALNLSIAGVGFVLESSDPAVLEIVDGVRFRGVAPGIANVIARDPVSGLTSPPVLIRVRGALASITLTPAAATRGIGEWESFTAIGNYPPDLHDLLTQRLVYSSSDPSVAVADHAPGHRSPRPTPRPRP